MKTTDAKSVSDPLLGKMPIGSQHEVAGCPTGLAEPIEITPDATAPHPILEVEKLEGRQEGGRDADDEDGKDPSDIA